MAEVDVARALIRRFVPSKHSVNNHIMTDAASSFDERSTLDTILFRSVLDAWKGMRGERSVPRRRDLLPELLPSPCFPHLLLTDFTDDDDDVIFRIIGEHVRGMCRSNWAGKRALLVSDPDYHRDYLLPLYREVATRRRPVWTVNLVDRKPGESDLIVNRLLLPFRGIGADVRHVLGVIRFDRIATTGRRGRDPWDRLSKYKEVERTVL